MVLKKFKINAILNLVFIILGRILQIWGGMSMIGKLRCIIMLFSLLLIHIVYDPRDNDNNNKYLYYYYGISGKHFLEFTVATTRSRDGRVTTAVTRWYCGWVEGEMCAVSRAPENVSRTSVAFGVASLAILLTGFVTGSWVTTREPYRVPGTDSAYTAAAFRIGLWKICPTLRKTNSTMSEYHIF